MLRLRRLDRIPIRRMSGCFAQGDGKKELFDLDVRSRLAQQVELAADRGLQVLGRALEPVLVGPGEDASLTRKPAVAQLLAPHLVFGLANHTLTDQLLSLRFHGRADFGEQRGDTGRPADAELHEGFIDLFIQCHGHLPGKV